MFRRFEKLIDPFQSYTCNTPPVEVWPFVFNALRPLRWVVAASLLLTAVGAILEVWLIGYSGRLVDTLAATRPGELWAGHGAELLVAALLLLVVRPLVSAARESLDDIAFRPNAVAMIRWRALRHVQRQSVGWFQNDFSGRIAYRVQELGNTATGAAYSVIHTISYVAIYVAGSIWLMASADLRLVIPMAIWVGLYFVLMGFVIPRVRNASQRVQEADSALSGMLVDTFSNMDTIKLFSRQRDEDRDSRDHLDTARRAFISVQKLEVTVNSSMVFLSSLLMVSLIGYSIILWQSGAAPLGMVAAALALGFRITAMAEWLLDAVAALFNYVGAARDQLSTIAQPVDIPDRRDATELKLNGGALSFEKVCHHYGKGSGGLDGVSLRVEAGEKVGVVGRSGAGKSTLVNLALRFFEAEGGQILVDGQDLRSVTQESLRGRFSMVAQNAALLHRSVRDNIAYGRVDLPQSMIEAAAAKAHADGFIPGLRDQQGRSGYEAHVGERGVKLSGGQRQRIALARAILKDAPILILDEATSALDSEVEAAIQDTLYDFMDGKTVIAIAHRLSTIARMDRVVVLDKGRIAQEGRHDDLLREDGIYARLWARQSGGFLGVEAGD
ncbi:ABC transporter ATP-binding protein [Rhizobium sp. T1470]|nr:ABC transporter ATP-binding protein [Rhizobium sp. T1473]MCA0801918.1 ABC transporter ATP-binding protein/permease [Rhizobium sp. T1473]